MGGRALLGLTTTHQEKRVTVSRHEGRERSEKESKEEGMRNGRGGQNITTANQQKLPPLPPPIYHDQHQSHLRVGEISLLW
jgi:hypothetical protein